MGKTKHSVTNVCSVSKAYDRKLRCDDVKPSGIVWTLVVVLAK